MQLAADHNERLQLAANDADCGPRHEHKNIIRASPIVEHEAIEHGAAAADAAAWAPSEAAVKKEHDAEGEVERPPAQRWTVSDHGRIVAVPPSPSSVAAARSKKPRRHSPAHGDGLDVPPLLVRASSGGSSVDSFLPENAKDAPCGAESGAESESLESPPRLDRSVITPSLFQDSVNGSSSEGKSGRQKNKRSSSVNSTKSRSSGSTSPIQGGGGCGARFDFLSQILDVFSLNGGCCHQNRDVACS